MVLKTPPHGLALHWNVSHEYHQLNQLTKQYGRHIQADVSLQTDPLRRIYHLSNTPVRMFNLSQTTRKQTDFHTEVMFCNGNWFVPSRQSQCYKHNGRHF